MGLWKWLTGQPSVEPTVSPPSHHAGVYTQQRPQAPVRDRRLGEKDVQIGLSRFTPANSWPAVTFMAATPQGLKYSCTGNDLTVIPYDQIRMVAVNNGILNVSFYEEDEMYISGLQDLYGVADMLLRTREQYIKYLHR